MTSDIMYKRKKNIVFHNVENHIYILDENKRAVYALNKTASEIWMLLRSAKSQKEIEQFLFRTYDVSLKTIRKDLSNLLSRYQKRNLIDSFRK